MWIDAWGEAVHTETLRATLESFQRGWRAVLANVLADGDRQGSWRCPDPEDVAGRLVQTFAKNLATMLSGGAAPEAAAAGAAAVPPARPGLEETPQESATASAKPEPPPPARAGSGPEAAAPPPPPPPPPSEDALDLGSLGGAVLADRLRQPRTLALVLVALVSYVLGRRSARR